MKEEDVVERCTRGGTRRFGTAHVFVGICISLEIAKVGDVTFALAMVGKATRSFPTVLKATSFASGMLSFLAFVMLLFCSTSAYLLSGKIKSTEHGGTAGSSVDLLLGVGPFVAGSSTHNSEVIWWSELNSENACNASLEIFKQWSRPHHLCTSDGGAFVTPTSVIALQVVSSLAIAFSFLSCTASFSSQQQTAVRFTAITSSIAMVFACTHFAIWTTYRLAIKLQSPEGDVIPLWDTSADSRIVPSKPVQMSFGISYVFFVISFVLLFFSALLSYSVARLPTRFFDEEDDDEGFYGTCKM